MPKTCMSLNDMFPKVPTHLLNKLTARHEDLSTDMGGWGGWGANCTVSIQQKLLGCAIFTTSSPNQHRPCPGQSHRSSSPALARVPGVGHESGPPPVKVFFTGEPSGSGIVPITLRGDNGASLKWRRGAGEARGRVGGRPPRGTQITSAAFLPLQTKLRTT